MGRLHPELTKKHSEADAIEETKSEVEIPVDQSLVSNIFRRAKQEEKKVKDESDDVILFKPKKMLRNGRRFNEIYPDVTMSDFKLIKFLGKGAFGTVDLVKCKLNDQPYALKQLSKNEVARHNRVQHLLREKNLMNKCHHPNIVRLETTFKDDENWYFLLEFHPLGDLAKLIMLKRKLTRSLTRFYAQEIVSVLEYFRKHNIVHRDMKPDNILIDGTFHCKVSDFGAAKQIDPAAVAEELKNVSFWFDDNSTEIEQSPSFELDSMEDRYGSENKGNRNTFVGTPLYVSPEMLAHNIACFGSDLWGLGCIIYQCLTGMPPFRAPTEAAVFDKIFECKLEFPPKMDPKAQDLIIKLMELDPHKRLGAGEVGSDNSFEELKRHPFFKNKSFSKLYKKKPPVSKKLIAKVNKAFMKDEADFSDDMEEIWGNFNLISNFPKHFYTEINEEKSPLKILPTTAAQTFGAVDKNSYLMSKMKKSQSYDYRCHTTMQSLRQ